MEMQIASIPLFDRDMAVESYLFRYRKGNDLFSTAQATGIFDNASRSLALETINLVGLDAFTLGRELFVPVSPIALLGDLGAQCQQPPEKIIFLFEDMPKAEEPYLSKMEELRSQGFRFAVSDPDNLQKYDAVLRLCDYCFLSQLPEKAAASMRSLMTLKRDYRSLKPVATSIHSNELLQGLYNSGYALYESRFHKVAVTRGETNVSPLKANSIRLINTVQDENFDFDEVTKVVQGDPALTISLMRMVNAPTKGMRNKIKTIPHAVAMLGQQEVRKWVTTAVSQSLGSDRPNEITRISLLRAKFAENLAPVFEMAHMAQGLFLMGLFSVLDVILEVPMEKALTMVLVSDVIREALVNRKGLYYPVLEMITDYESANWSAVSRHMIIHDINEEDLSNAYIEALIWYRNLMTPDEEGQEGTPGEEMDA